MKGVAFYPLHNTPGINPKTGAPWRDASTVFKPEAERFAALHGIEVRGFDNRPGYDVRRREIRAMLAGFPLGELDCVAFFCHGWKTGIQAGWSTRNIGDLSQAISDAGTHAVAVPLYCCSTGGDLPGTGAKVGTKGEASTGGDGGFADQLRDRLCVAGDTRCRVLGHTVPGHATRLPYVREFPGNGSPVGGTGGTWLVAPGSALWRKWTAALQGKGTMRLRFPFLSAAEIHRELSA